MWMIPSFKKPNWKFLARICDGEEPYYGLNYKFSKFQSLDGPWVRCISFVLHAPWFSIRLHLLPSFRFDFLRLSSCPSCSRLLVRGNECFYCYYTSDFRLRPPSDCYGFTAVEPPNPPDKEVPTTACSDCNCVFPCEDAYTSVKGGRIICENCFKEAETSGRARLKV